jgi:hypothetical protein
MEGWNFKDEDWLDDDFYSSGSSYSNSDSKDIDGLDVAWSGNKAVLPFLSLCDKTKSIFTMVKGIPIEIRENDGENYIIKENGKFIINVCNKEIDGLPKFTAFNHELAHYAFDSANIDFPDYVEDEMSEIPISQRDKAGEIYRYIFNILEDQRVESLLGATYLGTGMRFKQARRKLGEKMILPCMNPIDALLYARNFQADRIPPIWRDKAVQCVKDTEMTNSSGSVEVVNPWILQNIEMLQNMEEPKPDGTGGKKEQTKSTNELKESFRISVIKNRVCDHREVRVCDHREVDNSDQSDKQMQDMSDALDEGNEESFKELMEESKKDAKAQIKLFKKTMEEEARKKKMSFCPNGDKIRKCARNGDYNTPEPNMEIAKGINKVLRMLEQKTKPRIRDVGDELSIEQAILRKARGYGDVMIQNRKKNKLAILVSIDASGSMSGQQIDTARDMMATLFKSIERIENVELKGIVWAGDSMSVGITEINSYRDCKRVNCNAPYGGTPTPVAVEYSERVLEQMKAQKKMMIVITDGYPNGSDGDMPADKLVRKEINRARKQGISTLGIWANGYGDSNSVMESMFGKNGYMTVNDMKTASDKIISEFKRIVLAQYK